MQVILLEYPGVKGEVTIAGYQGYIAVESVEMSAGSAGDGEGKGKASTLSQRGYADAAGFESFDDAPDSKEMKGPVKEPKRLGLDSLKISKSVDRATPKLLHLAFSPKAKHGATVRIVVFRAFERQSGLGMGGINLSLSTSGLSVDTDVINWHEPFLEIELTDAHVAGHSVSIGKDSLSESLEISFKALTMDYIVYQNGKRLGTVSQEIDLRKKL